MRTLLGSEIVTISGGTSVVTYSTSGQIIVEFPVNVNSGFVLKKFEHDIAIYEAGNESWFQIQNTYFDYPLNSGTVNGCSVIKTPYADGTTYSITW